MSDDSEALIREIDEEMRREKLAKLWAQYGKYFVGGLVGVVLLVGGWQWYTAYQKSRSQQAGGQFHEALVLLDDKDKKKDGLAGLEQIAKEGTPAYATLAKLRLAAARREGGEGDKALELYTGVANDTSADQLLRSFANLQIASLKVDDGSWTDVQNRLNALASDDGPWRYSARELLGLAAFKHEKWAEARQTYSSLLTDPGVPDAMRQRAQIALALITREETPKSAEKPSQSGAEKSDLKKDKTAGDGDQEKAGAGDAKPAAASSNGAGAKNDAEKKN